MTLQTSDYFLMFLLLSTLSFSAIIDLRAQKIPNLITFPSVIIALLYHFFTNGIDGLIFSALGLTTGIGLLIVPYMLSVTGAGDAKLMGAVGAILGSKIVFIVFLFTALVGGIYSVITILLHHKQFKGFFFKTAHHFKAVYSNSKIHPRPRGRKQQ